MALPLGEAALLGALFGWTDVLPVSAEGHLALARLLVGVPVEPALGKMLHAGTLAATLLVLRKRATGAFVEGFHGLRHLSLLDATPGGRDAVVIALAAVPTAIVGLALARSGPALAPSPTGVGVGLLASAIAIGSTYWAPKGEKETPTRWEALLIGVAQGAAVLPGLSRTAATIAALVWLGVQRNRAFELSFLVSIPAFAGAALLGARPALQADGGMLAAVVAAGACFLASVAAIAWLRGVLASRAVAGLAIYLVPLGLAAVAWGYARP